jgi:putative NADH-flavin reductase
MKVVIFGATGRTGMPMVKQALDAGHEVIAFVRNPAKLGISHERLKVVTGDVTNSADVARAIEPGTDAVVSLLAPTKGAPVDMLPRAADNMLAAMQKQGVRRWIYMTGAGVRTSEDKPKVMDHVIRFMLKTMAGYVLKQSELAVAKVRASDRDWTVVRAPMLTDGNHTGQYRVGWVGVNTGMRLARPDAADFILKQMADKTYLRKAPMLSN